MSSPPETFLWSGAASGVKQSGKPDLGLAYRAYPADAAVVLTRSALPAAPVRQVRERLGNRETVRGVVVNSGVANAATGRAGRRAADRVTDRAADLLNVDGEAVLSASTGVIGRMLPDDAIREALPGAVDDLQEDPAGFARAILTTDAGPKRASETLEDIDATLAGVAKGAGMIRPDMATMLAFVFLDHPVEPDWWQSRLERACEGTFNRISVDGQMSTNDTVLALAARRPDRDPLGPEHPAADDLEAALESVCGRLAGKIVADGEGATCTIEVTVTNAGSVSEAETAARAVAGSNLVKSAFHGGDPNWGRIYAAVGAAGVELDREALTIGIDGFGVYGPRGETGPLPDGLIESMQTADEHRVEVDLGAGEAAYTCWTCDLSEEYVTLNAEYHT